MLELIGGLVVLYFGIRILAWLLEAIYIIFWEFPRTVVKSVWQATLGTRDRSYTHPGQWKYPDYRD